MHALQDANFITTFPSSVQQYMAIHPNQPTLTLFPSFLSRLPSHSFRLWRIGLRTASFPLWQRNSSKWNINSLCCPLKVATMSENNDNHTKGGCTDTLETILSQFIHKVITLISIYSVCSLYPNYKGWVYYDEENRVVHVVTAYEIQICILTDN